MVDFSSTSFPKPKNWQDFERNCLVLFTEILRNPHTLRHGRQGQPQNGVDIYGQRGGPGGPWVGIQCKQKDDLAGTVVTITDLREEVEKARRFLPPISEFFLVTTGPSNVSIQSEARRLTEENEDRGLPMTITVWGWDEGMSRALLNLAGRALPVDDAMRLSVGSQVSVWSRAWPDAQSAQL